ncbi:MAG: hypothetical protein Q7S10_01625 [bacterium]|nr:hypothetical protein [bacterium]
MTIQERIKNLQALPENKKKLVFFSAIVVVGLVLLVFVVKNTKDGITKIGQSVNTISLPKINIPDYGEDMSAIDFGSIVSNLASLAQTAEFLEYKNNEYGFGIKHPKGWMVSSERISKTELNLVRNTGENSMGVQPSGAGQAAGGKEVAGIHIEVISQTEKPASIEAGIDKVILGMREVMVPKREISLGAHVGYEVVGTLCIQQTCLDEKDGMYAPFSVIYFSNGKEIFEAQYGEGVMGAGWKNNIIDWKYYEEYKSIISTFTYNK